MDLALTDATGSGADLVPVAIRRVPGPAPNPAAAQDAVWAPTGPPAPQPDLAIGEVFVRGL
jgi:hypothetical protein